MTESTAPKHRPPATPSRRWLREVRHVWLGGWTRLRRRLGLLLAVYLAGLGLVWFAGDTDRTILDQIHLENRDSLTAKADFISDSSDLVLAVPVSIALWLYGAARGRVRWRKLGLACLMAALMGGLLVQIGKHLAGRPRPDAVAAYPERLYGPTGKSKLHSFPSGHTGTSTATGASLVAAGPVMIVPATLYAGVTGWSRMQLRKHYPLDVATSLVIGTVVGFCFASAVPGSPVRLSRRRRSARSRIAGSPKIAPAS